LYFLLLQIGNAVALPLAAALGHRLLAALMCTVLNTPSLHVLLLQIGNAVAPPLAAALGRCLLLAATEDAPVGVPVVSVPDPEYEMVLEECKEKGLGFWCQQEGNMVDKASATMGNNQGLS
jgi:hypothetical protein